MIERFEKKRHKARHCKSSVKQDLQSIDIWMANNHIQNRDFSVLSLTIDNSILKDISSYEYAVEGRSFSQGWERRYQTDLALYGDSFLENYKDILKVYVDKGHKIPLGKISAAMLQCCLNNLSNSFQISSQFIVRLKSSKLYQRWLVKIKITQKQILIMMMLLRMEMYLDH